LEHLIMKYHLEEQCMYGRTILKWIWEEYIMKIWTKLKWIEN
jgi:hypothetical protein